jgi:hypothetical protein
MKRLLFALPLLLVFDIAHAQTLKTVTGVRIYEHHSSSQNNNAPFGSGANGKKAGYNFVENRYFSSVDSTKPGWPWKGNEPQHIDLVEHKGPYGGPGQPPFGFTSGASTIWGGTDIKGNGTTVYMEAPSTFNYDTTTNVATIQKAYKAASASVEVAAATQGKVYLVRVRNTDRYVAMKITAVKNRDKAMSIDDVYFDFDYKWGDYVKPTQPNNVADVNSSLSLNIHPNPATDRAVVSFIAQAPQLTLEVYNTTGQLITKQAQTVATGTEVHAEIDLTKCLPGLYNITVINGSNTARCTVLKN